MCLALTLPYLTISLPPSHQLFDVFVFVRIGMCEEEMERGDRDRDPKDVYISQSPASVFISGHDVHSTCHLLIDAHTFKYYIFAQFVFISINV